LTRPRFALDENFPTPIVEALSAYIPDAELVSVREIDRRLESLEDWELLLALHHHHGRWAGLITNDSGILSFPKALAVAIQTGLILVVAESAGHDPILATGLVLSGLPQVCKRAKESPGGIYRLRAPRIERQDPREFLARVAAHRSQSKKSLFDEHKLSERELSTDPLSSRRS
jgi:hypothetical protein